MRQKPGQTTHIEPAQPLETLWDNLLSRQPERICTAFNSLDQSSQKSVRSHLQRMATEEGWQPEQRLSALSALQALEDKSKQGEK